MAQNHFIWNSLMLETCDSVGGNTLPSPVQVADLVGIQDSPFTLGEDDADAQVLLCDSAIEIGIVGGDPFTAEFFGAAPRPPHK